MLYFLGNTSINIFRKLQNSCFVHVAFFHQRKICTEYTKIEGRMCIYYIAAARGISRFSLGCQILWIWIVLQSICIS